MRFKGTLDAIQADEGKFVSVITVLIEELCADARLMPVLSATRLSEIWTAWCTDLERVGAEKGLREKGLDHFKRASHLAFWIRRFTPLIEAADLNAENPHPLSERQEQFRDLMFGYGTEYLAFNIGYQFCSYYERTKTPRNDRAFSLVPSMDYIVTVCNVMKYKTISPHAMMITYRSLFEPNVQIPDY